MALTEVVGRRLRTDARAGSHQVSGSSAGQLPLGRCAAHAESGRAAPCASCMLAQQQRLQAHYAASVAAAQEWRARRASVTSAFS
jgi:hypothetical protein